MAIKRFAGFLVHLLHHQSGVFIEQIDEALEHVQMEGGSDELAVLTPFVTWNAKEQFITYGSA